jgi:hypothetical protein
MWFPSVNTSIISSDAQAINATDRDAQKGLDAAQNLGLLEEDFPGFMLGAT